jgi:hypothetical protein
MYVKVCKGETGFKVCFQIRLLVPLRLGSDEMVSMKQMQALALGFAGKPDMPLKHIPGPEGVRGRNSNNGGAVCTLSSLLLSSSSFSSSSFSPSSSSSSSSPSSSAVDPLPHTLKAPPGFKP